MGVDGWIWMVGCLESHYLVCESVGRGGGEGEFGSVYVASTYQMMCHAVGDPYETPEIQADLHNDLTIALSNRYEHPPSRETYAELEIDVLPWQIINRRRLEPRYLHESLRELLHPETINPDEKLVRSMRELWAEENRRRVSKGLPELVSQSQGIDGSGIRRISLSQEDRAWKGGDWDASERFWEGLKAKVQSEKGMKGYEGRMGLDKVGQPSVLKGHSEWDRVSGVYKHIIGIIG